jgi:hypothetical protein
MSTRGRDSIEAWKHGVEVMSTDDIREALRGLQRDDTPFVRSGLRDALQEVLAEREGKADSGAGYAHES